MARKDRSEEPAPSDELEPGPAFDRSPEEEDVPASRPAWASGGQGAPADDGPSPPPFTLVAPVSGRPSGTWLLVTEAGLGGLAGDEAWAPPSGGSAWSEPASSTDTAWPEPPSEEPQTAKPLWPGEEEKEDEPDMPPAASEWAPEDAEDLDAFLAEATEPKDEPDEPVPDDLDLDLPEPSREDEMAFEPVEFEGAGGTAAGGVQFDEVEFEAVQPTEEVAPPAPAPPWEDEAASTPAAPDPFAAPGDAYQHGEYTLFAKEVDTPTGARTIHFFAKRRPADATPSSLPAGFVVAVNDETGLPFLRKA